jgi:predicted DNA-binding protein (MmcQ/YjbR family)
MVIDLDSIFKYKIINRDKLLRYGFVNNGVEFHKQIQIMKKQFTMNITVKSDSTIHFTVIDNESNEEYVLVHAKNAQGSFIGEVRDACEKVLTDIAYKCFDTEILKAEQTKQILTLLSDKYGAEPEFLWDKYPDYAAFRRKDNAKWFAIIMTVDKSKLGIDGHGSIEIIDLKAEPNSVNALILQKCYFPAYHMNKKHWYTVCLDGSISDDVLSEHIAESFRCSGKR